MHLLFDGTSHEIAARGLLGVHATSGRSLSLALLPRPWEGASLDPPVGLRLIGLGVAETRRCSPEGTLVGGWRWVDNDVVNVSLRCVGLRLATPW
jgi:hypothetical protein